MRSAPSRRSSDRSKVAQSRRSSTSAGARHRLAVAREQARDLDERQADADVRQIHRHLACQDLARFGARAGPQARAADPEGRCHGFLKDAAKVLIGEKRGTAAEPPPRSQTQVRARAARHEGSVRLQERDEAGSGRTIPIRSAARQFGRATW
jgi:hypothetical protein